MDKTITWLLKGDVSVQYMVHRWLLDADESTLTQLQSRIALEGFGAKFLSCQNPNGHWGFYYYQTKWISTHYTLLDLQSLCAPRSLQPCRDIITRMFDQCMKADGSLNLAKSDLPGDICVEGMALNYSAYFCPDDPRLGKLAGHLLSAQKADGGYAWDIGSYTGDLHTTICVLEGLGQYLNAGPKGRKTEIKAAQRKTADFLLSRQMFMDDKNSMFRKLSFPYRYRFDLLRMLECCAEQDMPYDPRMKPALDWLQGKRRSDRLWYLENIHKGNVHFVMEELKAPSRFITVKALRILRHYADAIG